MVSLQVVSQYNHEPPAQGRTKIDRRREGRLYDLQVVRAILDDEDKLLPWTRRCVGDLAKLFDGDKGKVIELIKSNGLTYIDSEWCENGRGAIAACDAYRIVNRENAPATGAPMDVEYYIKFAIGLQGNILLLCQVHV